MPLMGVPSMWIVRQRPHAAIIRVCAEAASSMHIVWRRRPAMLILGANSPKAVPPMQSVLGNAYVKQASVQPLTVQATDLIQSLGSF